MSGEFANSVTGNALIVARNRCTQTAWGLQQTRSEIDQKISAIRKLNLQPLEYKMTEILEELERKWAEVKRLEADYKTLAGEAMEPYER